MSLWQEFLSTTSIGAGDAALRLLVATVLGFIIGLDRELRDKPLGMRTFMLVSIGAALFSLISVDLVATFAQVQQTEMDRGRVIQGVVIGIGFLGGGAILREGMSIRGLTTAASLWVSAAIGLGVGLQAYLAAVAVTVLALVVLVPIKWLEEEGLAQRRQMEVTLTLDPDVTLSNVEKEVRRALPHSRVLRVQYREGGQELVVIARPQLQISLASVGEKLLGLPGVHGVTVNR